jgi:hypothetical protein
MISSSKILVGLLSIAVICTAGCSSYADDKPAPQQLQLSGKALKKGGKETANSIADGDVIPAPPGMQTGTK